MTEDSTTEPPEEPEAPAGDAGDSAAASSDGGPESAGPPPPPYAPSEAVSGLVEPESGPPTEVLAGAAFAGGVALALILRRLTS